MSTGPGQDVLWRHPHVTVSTAYGQFDVDAAIAELIVLLHSQGIETLSSCQGDDVPLSPCWWRRVLVAWRRRRLDEAGGRGLSWVTAPWGPLDAAGDVNHGYLLFPGSGAREFYALVLEATSASSDPRAALVHSRQRRSLRDAVERDCTTGLDPASLREFVTGRWYFELVEGYPDLFEHRTAVRFPRRDVELVTAAVRELLAGRAGG